MNARKPPRRARLLVLLAVCAAAQTVATTAVACDLCAIYTGSLMQHDKTGFALGVAEQYTNFGTIRVDGDRVSNADNEWMHSSITQVVVGYAFTPRIGVQANIPLISREYRRMEDGTSTRGDVGGFGDMTLLLRGSPFSRILGNMVMVHVELLAGLKLPTGDSDRLSEELAEDHRGAEEGEHGHSVAGPATPRNGEHEHESAVHGHDLALGSGSVDGVFGTSVHASWRRLFGDLSVQYIVRGNGDFSYEYANDLTWEAAPGVYVVTRDDWTAALRFVTSGENKGRDHQQGSLLDDTAITTVYVGPGFQMTWSDALHADFTVDAPVEQDTTGRQIVADYRLRGGVVWRF